MKMIYMVAADVLRALGWEVVINDEKGYYNLVLTNTSSSEDMPQSHKSCLRGLLRGWLMDFNYEGGHQQVNIYKELHGLNPEDDRYSCLDACVNRTDSNTPVHELDDKEVFVRRNDRFDRDVLTEPIGNPSAKTFNGLRASAMFVDEEEQPKKKKRPEALSMFYALLLCLLYVAIIFGVNILLYKLFGLHCGIDTITFNMVFSIIWVLFYIQISED